MMELRDSVYYWAGDQSHDDYGDGSSSYSVDVFERREGRGTTISVVQVATGLRKTFHLTTPFVQADNFCQFMSAGAWASHFPSKRPKKKGKK